jgi:hypothetical protein
MNLKFEITRSVAHLLNLDISPQSLKKFKTLWWQNPRTKLEGGVRLTEQGFEAFQKADLKAHRVRFEEHVEYDNRLIIRLDRYIDCPWYIKKDNIFVFSDRVAVQLVLFSGNITKFINIKAEKNQI